MNETSKRRIWRFYTLMLSMRFVRTDILWQEKDFDTAVRQVLALVGMEFSADSVYVSKHDNGFGRTYLWNASGLAKSP